MDERQIESLPSELEDMYHYGVFEDEILLAEFRFDNGTRHLRFEALLAAFKELPQPRRIIICQDT
jgi:hypothetical protein